MSKLVFALLLSFLVFGIMLHFPLVIAEEGSDSDNSGTSVRVDAETTVTSDSDDDSDDLNDEEDEDSDDEDEKDDDDEKNRIETRTREILTSGNCTIKIERRTRIEEGRRVEVVEKKMTCADGTRTEVKIKIESRTEDGRVRERIKYELRGEEFDVDAEEGIDLEEETNGTEYKLKARLRSTGNITDIKIMPDIAAELALERLRALNFTNFTVELREIRHKNIPRVVYNIETNKNGKFLGIFKLKLKVEGQVDPETGEFLGVSKPWWAFLVSGVDSDQTQPGEDEEETEETQITLNLLEQNDSGESGTATLVESDGQVTVTLSTTGFQEDVSQPAHIHLGSCPDVGAVSYPLTNVLNGESVTTLDVTFERLESELPLAINIHKSAEESTVYTACGNLGF